MMTKNAKFSLTILTFFLLALVACQPVTVFVVTPTPEPSPTLAATDVPTAQAVTLTPTTAPPEVTAAPPVVGTPRGPIIGPGYVPPVLPTSAEAVAPPPTIDPGAPTVDPAAPTTDPVAPPATTAPEGPTPTPIPNLDAAQMGIQLDANLDDADWNEAMRRITDLGMTWIKVQIPWEDMQPINPDERDNPFFRRVELHLEDASQRSLNVLVSIVKAPGWARSVLEEDGPPDDPQLLANFITLLLSEYGDVIDAIEVWNEPNLSREWRGTLPFTGGGYMRLFEPAYRAVRAYSATLPVITAGLAPTGNTAGSIDDREFLRQMYAAGLGRYTDVALGVHPYGWGNAPDATCCGTRGWDNDPHFFFADTIREYREIMVANGHQNVQMWFTEFGWATWEGFPGNPPEGSEWMLFNDRWAQANYTMRAFEIGQQTDYIGMMFLWNLNFAVLEGLVENRDERAAYSIVLPGDVGVVNPQSEGLTERPLYWMIYDALRPNEIIPHN